MARSIRLHSAEQMTAAHALTGGIAARPGLAAGRQDQLTALHADLGVAE
jgi:hypothetical protein